MSRKVAAKAPWRTPSPPGESGIASATKTMMGLMAKTSSSEMLSGWMARAISQMLTLVSATMAALPARGPQQGAYKSGDRR